MASLLAAAASWMRGGRYVYSEPERSDERRPATGTRTVGATWTPDPGAARPDDVSGSGRRPGGGRMITRNAATPAGSGRPADRRGGQADRADHPHPALLGGAGPDQPQRLPGRGERLYSPTDMARVTRIRDLQELLGFSLAEVRVVLDTEDIDVLDRLRSEYRWGDASPERRRQLLDEAIEANEKLLDRLDNTLARIGRVPGRAGGQGRPIARGPCRARRRLRVETGAEPT